MKPKSIFLWHEEQTNESKKGKGREGAEAPETVANVVQVRTNQ